jgi:hypothetical protein
MRHGKIHLWHYENQALLQISIFEKLSSLTTISEDLLYQISDICRTVYGVCGNIHL